MYGRIGEGSFKRILFSYTLYANLALERVQNDKICVEGIAYLLQPIPLAYSVVQIISFKFRTGSGSLLASIEFIAAEGMYRCIKIPRIRLYNKTINRYASRTN